MFLFLLLYFQYIALHIYQKQGGDGSCTWSIIQAHLHNNMDHLKTLDKNHKNRKADGHLINKLPFCKQQHTELPKNFTAAKTRPN